MATATSKSLSKRQFSPMQIAKIIACTVIAVIAIWLVWNWATIKGEAQVGVAYGAHITCSCRYIEGRDMASCETDKEAGMEMVSLSDDPTNQRIYASVPFLAEAVAERRGDFGCVQLSKGEMEAL